MDCSATNKKKYFLNYTGVSKPKTGTKLGFKKNCKKL